MEVPRWGWGGILGIQQKLGLRRCGKDGVQGWGEYGESDKGWARPESLWGAALLTGKDPGSGEVEGQRGKALGVR